MEDDVVLVTPYSSEISVITLNRPQCHNAFDDDLIISLTSSLVSLSEDPNVRVILITANGKNFCAGADLNWMKSMVKYSHEENLADALQLMNLLKQLANCPKPIIALAKGATLGGGLGILACSDIVLAKQDATFCFSEAKLGLIPATIAPYIVAALGVRITNYYFLTAKRFGAVEAQAISLVQEVVTEKELFSRGIEVANSLLQNGPEALAAIKYLMRHFKDYEDSFLEETANLIAAIRVGNEAQEGLAAFFEKRKPKWAK